MKRLSKTIGAIATVMTVAVLIIAGVLVIPRLFGVTPYIVTSGSMEPTISTGAVAFVNTHDTDIETGDVIAYALENGTVVLHRVTGSDGSSFTTQGDANDVQDMNTVSQDQVIGTYLFHIDGAGYLLSAYENNMIRVGSLTVPAAAFFVAGVLILLYLAEFLLSDTGAGGKQEGK